MTQATIIDISYCQPVQNIDWAKLKTLRVGVIMRMGQHTYQDNLFRAHYDSAVKHGVPFGVYWFYQPNAAPSAQVNAFMTVWQTLPVKPKVIYLDVENISYRDENGKLINILPPNAALHSQWLNEWLTVVEDRTGVTPGIYTRADYWDAWTVRTYQWAHWPLWIASWTNYSANVRLPRDWTTWTVWQYEGGTGRQDGVIGPVDKNFFSGDEAAMESYFAGQTPPEEKQMVSAMYDYDVAQNKRAWIVRLDDQQKLAPGVTWKETWVDGVILPAMRMDRWDSESKHMLLQPVASFGGRAAQVKAAGLAVVAEAVLDGGMFVMEQHTASELQRWDAKSNLMLRAFLQAVVKTPNWTYEQLYARQVELYPFDMVNVRMVETHTYPKGSDNDLGVFWQALTMTTFIDHLHFLMGNGALPEVPIALATMPEWLVHYKVGEQNDLTAALNNRRDYLYLHLLQNVNTSTATFPNLGAIFIYPPADQFKFAFVPDGYERRVLMHRFSSAQKVNQVTDANGVPTPVEINLWQSDTEGMAKLLAVKPPVVVEPPVEPPPPVDDGLAALTKRVEALEAWAGSFAKLD